jgi:hypothetical protein
MVILEMFERFIVRDVNGEFPVEGLGPHHFPTGENFPRLCLRECQRG